MSNHTALVSIKLFTDVTPLRVFMQPGQTITVGSSQLADYQIGDSALDKIHMRISFNGGRLFAETVSVENQFRLNGNLCDRRCLAHGDELLAGSTEFNFSVFTPLPDLVVTDEEILEATSDTVKDDEHEASESGADSPADPKPSSIDNEAEPNSDIDSLVADEPIPNTVQDVSNGLVPIDSERQNSVLNRYFFDGVGIELFARVFSAQPLRLVSQSSIQSAEMAKRQISVVFELRRLNVYGLELDCETDNLESFFQSGVVLVPELNDEDLKNHLLDFRSTFRSVTSIVTNLLFGSEESTTRKMKGLEAVFIPSETNGWHAFSLLSPSEFENRFGQDVFRMTD